MYSFGGEWHLLTLNAIQGEAFIGGQRLLEGGVYWSKYSTDVLLPTAPLLIHHFAIVNSMKIDRRVSQATGVAEKLCPTSAIARERSEKLPRPNRAVIFLNSLS